MWEDEIQGFLPDIEVDCCLSNPNRLLSIHEREVTLYTIMPDLLYSLLPITNLAKTILHVIIYTYSTGPYRTLYRPNGNKSTELNESINRIGLGAQDDDLD